VKKYISLARAVERSSYSAVEWSKLAKRGVIDAREHEDGWYINEAELDRTFDATYFNELTRSPLRTPGRPMQSALVGVLLILGLAVTMASWQASDLLPKLATGDFSSRQGLAAVAVSMVATSTPTSTPVATSDPITVSSNNSWWSAWQSLLETLAYLQERVTTNWENFLGLSTSPPVIESPATTGGLATSTTQLQRLIDQRVNLTIQSLLKNPASSQGSGGSGMISEIAENIPYKFISTEHLGEIKDGVIDTTSEAVKKWLPAFENYTFTDNGDSTLLQIDMEMGSSEESKQMKEMFEGMWPKALLILKEICEK
jgi:hypothetical protein